jgi:hypothetical protein
MTAKDLLKAQMNEAEYQLGRVLDGFENGLEDEKPVPTIMSAHEQVEHLTEVYIAAAEQVAGESHEWGTYSPPDPEWHAMIAELWRRRAEAEQVILASDDCTILSVGSAFLVSHDNYHIGQLCTLRIALDTVWDPYCIYPSD